MSLREPDNTRFDEPVLEDSGIHTRDTERAPMTLWQMTVTALLVVAILCVFFYGVTSQREEVTGPAQQQTASSVPPANGTPSQTRPPAPAQNAASTQGNAQRPTTTGQGH
jgi:hypothetical protein